METKSQPQLMLVQNDGEAVDEGISENAIKPKKTKIVRASSTPITVKKKKRTEVCR